MGKKIGFAALLLIAVLVAVIAMQPDTFRIERSTEVHAPADIVFAQINDFHKWVSWSPWEKRDPNLQRTYSGADAGEGAKYSWVGNDDVGSGHMTITESHPGAHVGIQLVFTAPFEATNRTDFNLTPTDMGTQVTWVMIGESNFMSKAFGLFMDMDSMVGGDFDKGLASLKAVSEAEAARIAEETANIAAAQSATAPTAAAVDSTMEKDAE